MIIEEDDQSLFIRRFEDYKRVVTPENQNGNFTYRGLRALYNYLDGVFDEENPLKLDVIALCCEFSEYKNLEEYLIDYSTEEEINETIMGLKEEDDERNEEKIRASIEFKTRIEEEINDKKILIIFYFFIF